MNRAEFTRTCDGGEKPGCGRADVLISVVVPVYNAAHTLEYTVGSILSPSFFDCCELILVDDGSTDGSGGICDDFAAIGDSVKVIHQKNGGVSRARNAGIAAASGKYIMFVDSDDILPSDCFSVFLDSIHNFADADIYIGGCTFSVKGNGRVEVLPESLHLYEKEAILDFFDDNYAERQSFLRPVWGKLFRRSLISEAALRFEPGLGYGEDVLFLFEYLLHSQSIVTIPRSVYTYRDGNCGLSSDRCSDNHLMQLMLLLQPYSETVLEMRRRWSGSPSVAGIYHKDVVGRIVCRILTVFATRSTVLCNRDNISRLYSYMSKDERLNAFGGLFSLRKGQMLNILLYKLSSPSLSARFYAMSSRVCTFLSIRPKSY